MEASAGTYQSSPPPGAPSVQGSYRSVSRPEASSVRGLPTPSSCHTSPSVRQRREFFSSDAVFPPSDLFPFAAKPEVQVSGMEGYQSSYNFGRSDVPGNLPAWW